MSPALKRIGKLSLSLRTLSSEAARYPICRRVTRLIKRQDGRLYLAARAMDMESKSFAT